MSINELFHRGTPHEGSIPHSGRYSWGSGEDPFQHEEGYVYSGAELKALLNNGYSQKELSEKTGLKISEIRTRISVDSNATRAANIKRCQDLREHGYSPKAIAEKMNIPERTVRNWLADSNTERYQVQSNVANTLKDLCDEKGYIDVSSGSECALGITQTKLKSSLQILKDQGYEVHTVQVKNVTDPTKHTNVTVLCPPGTTWGYIQNNQDLIKPVTEFSPDGGKSIQPLYFPESISSDRVGVRYGDEGGKDMDGVMLLRKGVTDISLGNSNYAQVRIAVDGTHYLKGMAMYGDDSDFPDGVDILFNTNKSTGTPMLGPKDNTVLKPLKKDKDLPFGAVIKAGGQSFYEDSAGKYIMKDGVYVLADSKTSKDDTRYSLSVVNKLKEEGEWDNYSKTLSSQFLSKQNTTLIKKQLDLSYAEKEDEYNDICSLSNPEIKKKLLNSFSSDCDASASHLKAAALPGQSTKVILPLTCMKDDQVYAPSYANGTQVCLVRYPHAGTFEIPTLTVNNNNAKAKKIMGNTPIDAIGINSSVAERLSGADFDGDTVVVIPLSDTVKIKTSKPLKGLEGFDPKTKYKKYEGMKVMTSEEKGMQMGMVSNLITDMTLKGATASELERAVKHSMVVIDAEKHELNWKQSEQDNGIAALQETYQKKGGGASTLISKASGETQVNERKQLSVHQDIDKATGKITYRETGRTYNKVSIKNSETGKKEDVSVYLDKDSGDYYYRKQNADGTKTRVYVDTSKVKTVAAKQKITKMENTSDARTLSSGTRQEELYADYANKLKKLANDARKEMVNTESSKVNKSAKETYASEVASLDSKLSNALQNSPRERQAQIIANSIVSQKKAQNPDMDKDSLKKVKQQALASARVQTGANKKNVQIEITDNEWEAIQAGAISANKLTQILNNTDMDKLKERATPRNSYELSSSKIALIKSRAASGFTIAEIADSMNISPSTVSKYLKS